MRLILLLTALASLCGAADWTLYACMATTQNYVVGAKLPPSGLFRRSAPATWERTGHPNPFLFAMDYDPRNPSRLYAAAGNGVIQLRAGAPSWRVLTGSDVTEFRDVALDARNPGHIYFAHANGIRVSRDAGKSWTELARDFKRRYFEIIRLDRARPGVLLAGGESGIYRSEDDGKNWKLAGADGFSVLKIAQSPHDPCLWLAVTEKGGVFASKDCGVTFENRGRTGVGTNLYDVSFDPTTPGRVAVAGWGVGVAVSADSGMTWDSRNDQLPSTEVWSVAFDPGKAGRLFAGVHEKFLYVSDDAGKTWRPDGLEGAVIYNLKFVPEVSAAK